VTRFAPRPLPDGYVAAVASYDLGVMAAGTSDDRGTGTGTGIGRRGIRSRWRRAYHGLARGF
jgi:hypothetical protein